MKYFILLILFFFTVRLSLAQEHESIHQIQYEQHATQPKQPSLFDPSGADIRPLTLLHKTMLSSIVFGYLPDWQYQKARAYLQYDLLTHIAAFDFKVHADGSLGHPSYWPWTDVINAAHAHGVKMIVTVVNFSADDIHTILTTDPVKQTFFANLKTVLSTYHMDGVNIDFEGLKTADRGSLLNDFMAELTTYIHMNFPGSEVSFAGPAVNWGGWDLQGLAQSCDYIFIMGYAFYGSWSTSTGPEAPLTGGIHNITNTVTVQYGSVTPTHPEKLILGCPYYGVRWQTTSTAAHTAVADYLGHPFFDSAMTEAEEYGLQWDGYNQNSWYYYRQNGNIFQVWFDTDSSLGLKYDLAEANALRGVGMWALGYDGAHPELWNELRRRYAPGTIAPPVPPTAVQVHQNDSTGLKVSFNAADFADSYRLYYSKERAIFNDSLETTEPVVFINNLEPNQLYFVKLRSVNSRGLSKATPVLAATVGKSSEVLIVEGFDRESGTTNTHDYMRQHAQAYYALGYSIGSATHQAVAEGKMNLSAFRYVDWLLGDESSATTTFSVPEQTAVQNYLQAGGRLLVSGSEIGWDLVAKGSAEEAAFYHDYLKSDYIADAPLGKSGVYYQAEPVTDGIFEGLAPFWFDDGSYGTFDVDWPDAIGPINGSRMELSFSGVNPLNGGCALSYSGTFGQSTTQAKLVMLSIPFETIYPAAARTAVLEKIQAFFNSTVSIKPKEQIANQFELFQNFPNPFNPVTVIQYTLSPSRGERFVQLTVYNILGQKVKELVHTSQKPGTYRVRFKGSDLAGGVYFYRLQSGRLVQTKKMVLLRQERNNTHRSE